MDEATYARIYLHLEAMKYAITGLETFMRLAQELAPAGVETAATPLEATADTVAQVAAHMCKIREEVLNAERRIAKLGRLLASELGEGSGG